MAQKVVGMDVRMASVLAGAVPNVSAFCSAQGISRQTFYKWRRRFAADGVPGLQERSRRPLINPGATAAAVEDLVVRRRKELVEDGADCGPQSIRWAMLADPPGPGLVVPSRATIARILTRRGLVVPEPRKRPHSSLHRFTYARPNECWQSDWTHWVLADGSPVAIAGALDDHSRFLVGLAAGPGDGTTLLVWAVMTAAVGACGVPVRSLTDNGLVYSGYRRGLTVAFEVNLRALGVEPICSSPYHPQTCGKIERFWQTLKRWLGAREPAVTVAELQTQLVEFRGYYNQRRPHRALGGSTPAQVFAATPPARPAARPLPAPVTVHTGHVSDTGVAPVAGYDVNVGRRWAGQPVTAVRDGEHIAVFSGTTLVREFTADPTRRYQPGPTGYHRRGHREPAPTFPGDAAP